MNSKPNADFNPYEVLGVGPEANDEQIRSAYLVKVKQFPPDQAPVAFEQIREPAGPRQVALGEPARGSRRLLGQPPAEPRAARRLEHQTLKLVEGDDHAISPASSP